MSFAIGLWWFALAGVAYTYAGYPLLIAALARLRPRPWQRAPLQTPVSIIMAVHNGAALLPWKLAHLLALDPGLIREVIVVSDGSTDTTAQILSEQTEPRLKVIILHQQAGKSAALNHAIARASSSFLLFVDIRPRLDPAAVRALISNFADPTVGCAAGELLVQPAGAADAAAASVSGVYWRYEQWIRNSEAAFDSPVGVYGGFYAARRELVRPAPDGLILDDMFQPLSIIRQGYRSVVDRHAIVVDTWPASTGAEFNRKVRTLAGNYQLIARAPWVLTRQNRVLFQLISHKLLRLVVPFLFPTMLLSALFAARSSPRWKLVAAAQAGTLALGIAGATRPRLPLIGRIAAPLGAVVMLNAAAVVGLYRFLFTRGPLWKIWRPTTLPAASPSPTEHARA